MYVCVYLCSPPLSVSSGEVYSVKFSHSGSKLASGGQDRSIFLWNGQHSCENLAVLRGHKSAITEVCWSSDDQNVVSASADRTAIVWDVETLKHIRKVRSHDEIVNCVTTSVAAQGGPSHLFLTGADDGSAMLFDLRNKESIMSFDCRYPVLSVAMLESANQVFTAGVDNAITCWDIRSGSQSYKIEEHGDTVTGIRLNRNGTHLASTSMDQTTRVFDVRPLSHVASSGTGLSAHSRQATVLYGALHGIDSLMLRCAWDHTGSYVSCGSADMHVYIWEVINMKQPKLAYKLPGHHGTVVEVDFSPIEPVIASCSVDKNIYLGEVEPEDIDMSDS